MLRASKAQPPAPGKRKAAPARKGGPANEKTAPRRGAANPIAGSECGVRFRPWFRP